jgi:MoxR-like ATPase
MATRLRQLAPYTSLVAVRDAAKAEVAKAVVGQEDAIDLLLIAAIARGHVLIEGPPGSAKTLLGRAMAHVLGAQFKRLQFTPDTTPEEITGRYDKKFGEIVFQQGAVFTNVLLADEINRTPPRTQASLLEAMQEHTVTVDGHTHRLPDPFLVIATQNPWEHEGIFPLPESQLDRFLFKIELDYCSAEHEVEMLKLAHTGISPDTLGEIQPLLGLVGLDKSRQELDATIVPDETIQFVIDLVRATREMSGVILGASSRGAFHLLGASKASARLGGRDTVTLDDVRAVAPHVLKHRLVCEGVTPETVLRSALDQIS